MQQPELSGRPVEVARSDITPSEIALPEISDGPPDPATLIPGQRARRERIVMTALKLLEEGEYESIQMRDVAEHADVAIGTVYRYFASKEHLFTAVLLAWSGALQARIHEHPLQAETPGARLNELLSKVLSAFEHRPQFLRMLMVVESTRDQHARQLHLEFGHQASGIFLEPLRDLERDDAEAIVDVVQGVMGAMLRVWAVGLMPMEAVRRRLTRTIDLVFSSPPRSRADRGSASPSEVADVSADVSAEVSEG